jgi:hypothetical protein
LNKTRTVDAIFIIAAVLVRRFHPFIDKCIQYYVGKAIRIDLQ